MESIKDAARIGAAECLRRRRPRLEFTLFAMALLSLEWWRRFGRTQHAACCTSAGCTNASSTSVPYANADI
jgi:hypothetical protein